MRTTHIISLIFFICLMLFSSCRIGKRYVRPEMDLPENLTDSSKIDSISMADAEWWKIYSDTTLQSLINEALEHNKDLNMAVSRVKQLGYIKRIDFANFFPQINGLIYADEEGLTETGKMEDFNIEPEYSIKLDISWEIDLWGNLRWKRDVSIAEFLASIENQRAVQMSIIAQVAQSYFELIALDNELFIVKQTLDARQEGLHLAHIRFTGGLTSETAYQQANVELAKTMTLIPDLERRIALKENEIAMLTGSFPKRINRSVLTQELNVIDSLPVGLPSTLMERRPDIRRAEQELIAANAAVGIAYTNMFPRFALTSQLGIEAITFSNILTSPYEFVSGSLMAPLFALGKNRAAWKAKQSAYEEAVYSYEKVVLKAFMEVRNAIVNYYKTNEIYASRLKLEHASKTALDLAQLQYINGVVGYLDLLDAQRGYFEAQLGLSNAMRDKQITLVNLYKVLGGGWQLQEQKEAEK